MGIIQLSAMFIIENMKKVNASKIFIKYYEIYLDRINDFLVEDKKTS